jgi:branched-chain amino acid transport system substrate-binding protein
VLLLVAAGCGGRPPTPSVAPKEKQARTFSGRIKIGEYVSLTGQTATFGQSTQKGIELAFREINAKGGVLGREVVAIVEDDAGDTSQTIAMVNKLINQDRVLAILGEVASTRSIAGGQVCQRQKVPMITPSSTNPGVTQKGEYVFRTCYTDIFQGRACADFAFRDLKAKKAAILKDVRQDYSVGLAQYFRERFEQLGGKIVAESSYNSGDTDFRAQLIVIEQQEPDLIFIPGYYTDVGLIAKQARGLRIETQLLGGDGWDGPELVEIGGEAVEGAYFSNHYSVDDPRPKVQAFVRAYERAFGRKPDAMAATAYDAAYVLAEAIARAGKLDREAIREEITKTAGFDGITGIITLDENRNPVKPAVILQVRGGKWRYQTTIEP